MIYEMDNCKSLTEELKGLTDDTRIRSVLDGISYQTTRFNSVLSAFNRATQTSITNYNENLPEYRGFYSQFIGYLQARETTCAGLIYGYQDALNNQLYPTRQRALNEFDKYERLLLEGKIQIDEALAKISGLQGNLDSLEAKFLIMDRTKNYGAINFNSDSQRMASIANVFPLMFFFVALLVVLTSMTRMIEEERTTIGTFKALGFSKYFISNKYLLYGVISSLIGSVIGLVLLSQFLPFVIMFAYSIMYSVPIPLPMPFN